MLIEQLLNEVELNTTSLDLQIDKYLRSYEKASQKNADKLTLSECFSLMLEDSADELIDDILGNTDGNAKKSTASEDDDADKSDKELDLNLDIDEPVNKKQKEPAQKKMGAQAGVDIPDEEDGQQEQPQDDTTQQDTTDITEPEQQEPVQKQRPGQIDVDVFASKVSNLVNNIENLLDVKSVIINRAHEIINTNYGEKDAKEFKQSLASKYSLKSADIYDKPY